MSMSKSYFVIFRSKKFSNQKTIRVSDTFIFSRLKVLHIFLWFIFRYEKLKTFSSSTQKEKKNNFQDMKNMFPPFLIFSRAKCNLNNIFCQLDTLVSNFFFLPFLCHFIFPSSLKYRKGVRLKFMA